MKDELRIKRICRITSIIIVMILSLLCYANSFAATGVYLGSGNVYYGGGDMNYNVRGYVYYNSNTSTALNLSSLAQWIDNYGVYNINEVHFTAHDGNFDKYTHSWGYINPVTTGNSKRVEADWEAICSGYGYNSVYQKNSSQVYAYTDIVSGYSYAGLGGWDSWWFASSRSDSFHY